MKVSIETFGCIYNKADSQIMAGVLAKNNMELVDNVEDADVIIVNTCYVKLPTESKVTNRIQKLQKTYPDKKVIVSGCMVEIDPEKIDKITEEGTSWIGPHQLDKTAEVVKAAYNGKTLREDGLSKKSKVGVKKFSEDKKVHIIQICEGCMGKCTFCCTRLARGPLHSYPIEDIKNEAKEAIENGCVEIELTAQDTAAFGHDTHEKLSTLIREVASLDGNFRIRIGMMHPKNIFDDVDGIIEAFKLPKVYKFMHLPVQTGSDKVLKEMNRRHTIGEYKDFVSKVREAIPEITIATDIIVGYPTETDKDFNETIKLLHELKPSIVHLSKYQHRKGALSSSLKAIPFDVMKKRSKKLTKIISEITKEENDRLLGQTLETLIVEKGSKGGYIGKTNSYLPVVVDDAEIGSFVNVKIVETTSTYLIGKIVD
ncbi:threonylcarbamoyladenosine tRNA methylthiotransferase [Methanobrevibacter sp. 87.7]|uniref:tRNA (N(6)-L-threonylcarbamoyladenosine(37)-C(2))- methylthiotransferase n=1 Tax=Methanobrevibacter sp. 87.7 TaxID=387957 RepID=UPI000B50330A|nr:tRNA (N(6)-L-threonylcarbamoyladenosine(37)-C(2))-methylthiotransferase [Methanobrevibacter sp. 87.7]OWT33786.1 threonylcarbamoyladenosine tRNA methylthiotransferase [Methanobrevibacter sp. 87.7]